MRTQTYILIRQLLDYLQVDKHIRQCVLHNPDSTNSLISCYVISLYLLINAARTRSSSCKSANSLAKLRLHDNQALCAES